MSLETEQLPLPMKLAKDCRRHIAQIFWRSSGQEIQSNTNISEDLSHEDVRRSSLDHWIACAQGSGFSEVIAGLEAELKSLRAANQQLADDCRACYAQIRAKDKELDLAAARVEEALRVSIENKV
jgi:hypothetical protein